MNSSSSLQVLFRKLQVTSDGVAVAKAKWFFYFGGKNADSTPVLIGRRRRRRLEHESLRRFIKHPKQKRKPKLKITNPSHPNLKTKGYAIPRENCE